MALRKFSVVDAWLQFESGHQLECSDFEVEYAYNAIPTATVRLPLGRLVPSNEISTNYSVLTNYDRYYRNLCSLYVRIETDTPGLTPWILSGEYRVFTGFVQSGSYEVSGEKCSLKLDLIHWLSDLNFSSTLSASSHPSNPKSLIYNPKLTLGSLAGSSMNVAPLTLIQQILGPISDLWSQGIYPFLYELASSDRINIELFMYGGNDGLGNPVRRALSSFGESYLPLNLPPEIVFNIANKLIGVLDQKPTDNTAAALAETTLWKKLVSLAEEFLFIIVPFPDFYRVLPVINGLQTVYAPFGLQTIVSDEVLSFEMQKSPPQVPLRAVGVYSGIKTLAGSIIDNPDIVTDASIGGWYISVPDPGYGLIQVLKAPDYLANPFEPSIYTRYAIGGLSTTLSSSKNPAQRQQGMMLQQKLLQTQQFSTLDLVAHYHFVEEQLKNRTATVKTPFRGDIAPGSTISVGLHNNNFIPDIVDAPVLYGLVREVRYNYPGAGAVPTSTYVLEGVRNRWEFHHPDYTITSHPLYGIYWTGDVHLPRLI